MEIHPAEMSQGENDYEKDLRHLTSTISVKIDECAQKAESFFSSSCIYRVPKVLRKLKESAYTPCLIAIGPLHRRDKHLQTPLQLVKMSYTSSLLSRLTTGMENQMELAEQTKFTVLQKCLAEIRTSIDNAKKCYVEEVTLDEEMMLVDGCFILEFLCRSLRGTPKGQKYADPICGNSMTSYFLKHDLLLLENQIPFFVLEKLFRLTVARIFNGTPYEYWSLSEHVFVFFSSLNLAERQSTVSTRSRKTFSCSPNDCVRRVFGSTIAVASDRVLGGFGSTTAAAEGESPPSVPVAERISTISTSSRKTLLCSPSDCVLRIFGSTTAAAAEEKGEGEEEEVQSGGEGEEGEGEEKEVQSGGNIDHRNAEYYHILHYIHDSYLPRDPPKTRNLSLLATEAHMPSASELVYAGVKFVAGPSNNLFNVQFTEPKGLFWWYHRACFEISPIKVDDSTEKLLRNLIALEQCCPGISQHFSSYATVMDMLVNTDKDIQVLEEAGVVINVLGSSKEATDLFNKLCKEIMLGFYFGETCIKADKYSKRFWPKNMAHVRGTYFKSPWTFIAFCVGFIAFFISLVGFLRDFLKKEKGECGCQGTN